MNDLVNGYAIALVIWGIIYALVWTRGTKIL